MLKVVAYTNPWSDGVIVEQEELAVHFEDTEQGWEDALDLINQWTDWIWREIDNVLDFANHRTHEGWSIRPTNVVKIVLVWEKA